MPRGAAPAARLSARVRALAVALAFLAAATPARGDRARIAASDEDAAAERVEMVLRAEREVFASYFIVGADPLSLTGLALLRDAARRGLDTRLLVDAQWSHIPRAVAAHLRAEGVSIRHYHPFRWHRPGWITRRMHDKLLVVDGASVLVGGRNVESTYFGLGRQVERRNYIDLDLRVDGPVAGEARAYFLALWASREVAPLAGRATPAAIAAAERTLDGHENWLRARVEDATERGADGDASRREAPAFVEIAPGSARFLHDPAGRKRAGRGIGPQLFDALESTRHSALIESPYLVPSRALRRALDRAQRRGARVRILTNSLASTDNLFPQAGYVGTKRALVARGVELWEYRGPECLHSKVAILDGELSIVGSFNLDPRSEFLNTETALAVRDRGLAMELERLLNRRLDSAWRIGADGRPLGARSAHPGVPRSKVWKLRLLRLIAPLIHRQLREELPERSRSGTPLHDGAPGRGRPPQG